MPCSLPTALCKWGPPTAGLRQTTETVRPRGATRSCDGAVAAPRVASWRCSLGAQEIDDGDTGQEHHHFVAKALQPLVQLLLDQLLKQDEQQARPPAPSSTLRTCCSLPLHTRELAAPSASQTGDKHVDHSCQ